MNTVIRKAFIDGLIRLLQVAGFVAVGVGLACLLYVAGGLMFGLYVVFALAAAWIVLAIGFAWPRR